MSLLFPVNPAFHLHLAYKQQVSTEQAQVCAEKLGVTFSEVSPLCNFT